MISLINEIKIDVACLGNHEFDFGLEHLSKLVKKIDPSFPWLLSNLKIFEDCNKDFVLSDKNDKEVLKEYFIKYYPKEDLKVGFMGLIEKDWIEACPIFKNVEYIYEDFIEKGEILVQKLKEEKCDLIICLTHMRDNKNIYYFFYLIYLYLYLCFI